MKKYFILGFLLVGFVLSPYLVNAGYSPVHSNAAQGFNFLRRVFSPIVFREVDSLNNVLVSEIMAGKSDNASYEFVELYNPTSELIDLTGWSVKKKSSTGVESTLVSESRLNGKIIPANKHFLLARENWYDGPVVADVLWASSNSLAYENNSVVIYNADDELMEEIAWTEIPADKSYKRISLNNILFRVANNPKPQNSQ
mgnify:CR=1 FL=1